MRVLVADLSVVRWRRYGHDRLYVNAADKTRVGWVDLRSGETVIERPSQRADFEQALAAWCAEDPARPQVARRGAVVDEPPPVASIPPPTVPLPSEYFDLALNRPGAASGEQAARHREPRTVRRFLARLLDVPTEERAWRVGAEGERRVAADLSRLGSAWHTLHAVPVGVRGADIDHLVIGPGGIFTINTKHHPDGHVWLAGDRLLINGRARPYVRNARHEASRAAKLLGGATGSPVAVTALIVVVGTDKVTVRDVPSDVWVVSRRQLVPFLTAGPVQLDPAEVARFFALARRSDTWQ